MLLDLPPSPPPPIGTHTPGFEGGGGIFLHVLLLPSPSFSSCCWWARPASPRPRPTCRPSTHPPSCLPFPPLAQFSTTIDVAPARKSESAPTVAAVGDQVVKNGCFNTEPFLNVAGGFYYPNIGCCWANSGCWVVTKGAVALRGEGSCEDPTAYYCDKCQQPDGACQCGKALDLGEDYFDGVGAVTQTLTTLTTGNYYRLSMQVGRRGG